MDNEELKKYLWGLKRELDKMAEMDYFLPQSYPACAWFFDMLSALKLSISENKPSPQIEKMVYMLLAFYPNLYEFPGSPVRYYKRGVKKKKALIDQRNYFVCTCHTLLKVEQQQQSKERASREAESGTRKGESELSKFSIAFWKNPLKNDDTYFEDISKYATEFWERASQFYGGQRIKDNSEEVWCEAIKSMFFRICYYPVTSMLIPALLTKYIVDGTEYESIYAFMKSRKASYPKSSKNNRIEIVKDLITTLYNSITERTDQLNDEWIKYVWEWRQSEIILRLKNETDVPQKPEAPDIKANTIGARTKAALQIPVKELADKLEESYHKHIKTAFPRLLPVISYPDILDVLTEKFDVAGYPFDKKQLWEKLSRYHSQNGLSFNEKESELEEVDRILFSVSILCNAGLYLEYKCGDFENRNMRSALDFLAEKKIICKCETKVQGDQRYLYLYEKFCKTFHICEDDLSTLAMCKYLRLDSWDFFAKISFFEQLYSLIEEAINRIKQNTLSVFCEPHVSEIGIYDKMPTLCEHLKDHFMSEDYGYLETFLYDDYNFTYNGFCKYLTDRLNIWEGDIVPEHWKYQIVYELFKYTTDLIGSVVLEQMRKYCMKQIEWYLVDVKGVT